MENLDPIQTAGIDSLKILICGKSGSGKDFLKRAFQDHGFRVEVSYTTRPPREGELDGQDYHFVDTKTFEAMIEKNQFVQYQIFNGWHYGTLVSEWKVASVFIMTPSAIRDLLISEFVLEQDIIHIIYLNISPDIRKARMEARSENADSVARRLKADDEDFARFEDKFRCVKITNPTFSFTDVLIHLLGYQVCRMRM